MTQPMPGKVLYKNLWDQGDPPPPKKKKDGPSGDIIGCPHCWLSEGTRIYPAEPL